MLGLFKNKNATLSTARKPPGTLEEQLAALGELGFSLNDGVTFDDLLYSFSRDVYEKRPFDLLLVMLGVEVEREPWGRPFCSSVWNFDTECICQSGDYVKIVKRLCEIAGKSRWLTNVEDFVDLQARKAWLKYSANGKETLLKLEVNNDWADVPSILKVMADIESDGRRFYFKDNGQSMVLYYLDSDTVTKLNHLTKDALSLVLQ